MNDKKQLPPGWRWVRLGEVCEFIRGVSFDKAEVSVFPEDGRLPVLRAGNIGLRLDTANDLIWVPEGAVSPNQILRVGDAVICMSSGSADVVGKTAQVEEEWKGSVGAFCGIVRAKTPSTADFVNLWFRSRLFLDWRDDQARGANIQNLRFSQLAKFEIPLPPLPEQRRIAAVLREQMAAVDKARAAAQVRLEAAEDLSSAFLRAVFDAAETTKWPTKRLGEVLVPHKEVIHPGDRDSGTATFVGLEHLESHTGRRIGGLPLDLARLTGRKPTFRQGQIVYGYLRPYLNKVWIAEFDGCSSVDQFAYNVREDLADVRFVAWFMRSPTYLRRSEVMATTGQLPRIGTEQIAAVEIGLPSLDEQHAIADAIDHRFVTRQKLRELLCEEVDAIEKMPSALLRRAFAGEV
jgi:restriction endonuclease S subunit